MDLANAEARTAPLTVHSKNAHWLDGAKSGTKFGHVVGVYLNFRKAFAKVPTTLVIIIVVTIAS